MTTELSTADRLGRAAAFGCKLHAAQTRDDGCTPYCVHLFRVVEYLRTIADERDTDVLCAAYLHDTIEDTGITYETVEAQFGATVASLVAELTNDNRLPKAQRRAAMIEHMYALSPRAKRIKLADRLDNVTDLLRGCGASKEKCERYIYETERILHACKGACPPLERALVDAFGELKQFAVQHRGGRNTADRLMAELQTA
ncbi:MAG TPA: HD domain-containing protein [Planctomycetota bacterium]|nr:HD domain-containing protein [Planctomycetota bacterium]